jgi:ligand-binding SRPBCC domain-containing protein
MYQFKQIQLIPAPLQEVWDFMSSPRNLSRITPPAMGFKITNEPIAEKMYAGQIIAYKVSPVLGIPMNWVTEITHVKELEYFVDEQRIGPYSMWHHQHSLKEIAGGVQMEDIVSYEPPFGFLGSIANTLFIKNQLDAIFSFRTQAVDKIFGTYVGSTKSDGI